MKRSILCILPVLILAVALTGCGGEAAPTAGPTEPAATQAAAVPTKAPATATPEVPDPTREPSTATATAKPPTATSEPPTATSEPPTTTATPEPPTATPEPPTATATSEPTAEQPLPALEIASGAFQDGGAIPIQYSCFGDNRSPQLSWVGVPAEAQSLMVLVYDLDAGTESGATTSLGFAHWIVYNIPPTSSGLPEDVPAGALADGSLQGSNDFAPYGPGTFPGGAAIKLVGYDGPCPGGEHRYVYAVYALDVALDLPAEPTMAQVLAAREGHVLAEAEVLGVFVPPE